MWPRLWGGVQLAAQAAYLWGFFLGKTEKHHKNLAEEWDLGSAPTLSDLGLEGKGQAGATAGQNSLPRWRSALYGFSYHG